MIPRRKFSATLAMGVTLGPLAPAVVRSQSPRQVTFVQPSPSAINSFPIFVAIGEGFFDKEGLEVLVEGVNGSLEVLEAMSAGRAQFGRPGPGQVLIARSRGVDVVFIYNVAARPNFSIVVPEASTVTSPADLRGAVVGVRTSDGAEVGFARDVLAGSGLSEGSDYTFLAVGNGRSAAGAFTSRAITAYSATTEDTAILGRRGVKLREITPPEVARFFGNGIATMGDTIRNDRDLVEKFGRAFARGHAFALDDANRDKVMAHLEAGNPQESADAVFASVRFDAVRAKTVPVDTSTGLGFIPPEVWEEWQARLVAAGDLPAPLPDLKEAFTNEFIAGWNAGLW